MNQAEACIWYWVTILLIFLGALFFRLLFPIILGPPGYY